MSSVRIPDNCITVIGGGPSGMTAAICAARKGAKPVCLIEKNDVLGRKLLATGNGRCNLTNINCPEVHETLDFFSGLGLLIRTEEEGRAYPYSEQASAVQEALISELQECGVEILCGREAKTVEQVDSGFQIMTDQGHLSSESVILTAGGKAGPQYGSTGDGYRFAKAFGHSIVRLMPSLVQMFSEDPMFRELKGVRAKGRVTLLRSGMPVDTENGEIQFTGDGLSGICIFNLSKNYEKGDRIGIDLFPEHSAAELAELLKKHGASLRNRTMTSYLGGILHKKLIPVILAVLKIESGRKAGSLTVEEINRLASFLKGWEIVPDGTKGWKEAQVTAGGVELSEVDPETLESKIVPGLYFAGELLDVDEKCGGFNLQWAWSSGMKAGEAAAMKFGK